MRQTPINSREERVRIAQASEKQLTSPIKLNKEETRHFNQVIARRAKADWPEDDLRLVALYAKLVYKQERLMERIEREGDVIDGKPNPRHGILNSIDNCINRRRKTLGLQPGAGRGGMQNQRSRFKDGVDIQKAILASEQDPELWGLIKRPQDQD